MTAGILLTVAGCAWLVAAERTDHGSRSVAKPLASIGFLVVAAAGWSGSRYDLLVVIGLILGFGGDVFLLGHGRRPFVAGLAAFLIGHLAYATAFVRTPTQWAVPLVLASAGAGLAAGVWRWLRPNLPDELARPVAAYVSVIVMMLITAALQTGVRSLVVWGAWLFAASDIAVARNEFVTRAWSNRVWGLPLYYAGQLFIASSVGT